jgi:hypothetical protein
MTIENLGFQLKSQITIPLSIKAFMRISAMGLSKSSSKLIKF